LGVSWKVATNSSKAYNDKCSKKNKDPFILFDYLLTILKNIIIYIPVGKKYKLCIPLFNNNLCNSKQINMARGKLKIIIYFR
jgi:hypothetical protein